MCWKNIRLYLVSQRAKTARHENEIIQYKHMRGSLHLDLILFE